jgi:hypothetical protein
MANTLKLKRSSVSGKIPTTSDLQLGELALNTYDGKLYTKIDNGSVSIVDLSAGSGGGGSVTIGASATDILSSSLGVITADSAGANKIVFWDNTNAKLSYLALGTNLTITGTTLDAASGGGSSGSIDVIEAILFV